MDWLFQKYATSDWIHLEATRRLLRALPRPTRADREFKLNRYFAHCHRAGGPDGRVTRNQLVWILKSCKTSDMLSRALKLHEYIDAAKAPPGSDNENAGPPKARLEKTVSFDDGQPAAKKAKLPPLEVD